MLASTEVAKQSEQCGKPQPARSYVFERAGTTSFSTGSLKMRKDNQTKWRQYAAAFNLKCKAENYTDELKDNCLKYAKRLLLEGYPVIYDKEHLSSLVGYSVQYIMSAAKSQKNYYRTFKIKKKSGSLRDISEPLPSLKEIQRWILDNILYISKASPYSKAYTPGLSLKDNARLHVGQKYVLTIDIADFFPTIHPARVYQVFRGVGYSKAVSALLTDLCCLNGALPQGAPTSPHLSNLVCKKMDESIFRFSQKLGIRFTRYADDLTFSGDFDTKYVLKCVTNILGLYGFSVNHKKTRIQRSHQRQIVTGIIVNSKMNTEREMRRKNRQSLYYINKFGIDDHMNKLNIEKYRYKEHLVGAAGFIKFINKREKDAKDMIRILSRQ